MTGLLYDYNYIEENYPLFVQRYKDKDGESALSLGGILVNEMTKKFLWGCFCQIKGPIHSIPKTYYNGYNGYYIITGCVPQLEGTLIPACFFEKIYKKEEKKSHNVTVRKLTKKGKNHSLITDDLINIADLKWWSIDEKIPPVGLPITLCVKERPSTSNCSPYNTFPAKYCYNSTSGKYIFIGMRGENYWWLTEDDFRWTVDAGRCPDF